MKKIYLEPETTVYKVNVTSVMATSFKLDEGEEGGGVSEDDFNDASREENTDNTNNGGNSVWDNIW